MHLSEFALLQLLSFSGVNKEFELGVNLAGLKRKKIHSFVQYFQNAFFPVLPEYLVLYECRGAEESYPELKQIDTERRID